MAVSLQKITIREEFDSLTTEALCLWLKDKVPDIDLTKISSNKETGFGLASILNQSIEACLRYLCDEFGWLRGTARTITLHYKNLTAPTISQPVKIIPEKCPQERIKLEKSYSTITTTILDYMHHECADYIIMRVKSDIKAEMPNCYMVQFTGLLGETFSVISWGLNTELYHDGPGKYTLECECLQSKHTLSLKRVATIIIYPGIRFKTDLHFAYKTEYKYVVGTYDGTTKKKIYCASSRYRHSANNSNNKNNIC